MNSNEERRENFDTDAFDSVTGLATTGGPSGAGITGKTIAGPDLTGDVMGSPLDADYIAGQRTNVTGDETDTVTGFAGRAARIRMPTSSPETGSKEQVDKASSLRRAGIRKGPVVTQPALFCD